MLPRITNKCKENYSIFRIYYFLRVFSYPSPLAPAIVSKQKSLTYRKVGLGKKKKKKKLEIYGKNGASIKQEEIRHLKMPHIPREK